MVVRDVIRQLPEIVGQVSREGAHQKHYAGEQHKVETYAPTAGATVGPGGEEQTV